MSPTEHLQDFLRTHDIPFQGHYVQGNLDLTDFTGEALPDGLTVHGSMIAVGTHLSRLPEELVVQDSLFLYNTACALPQTLRVGRHLSLESHTGPNLPGNFQVPGSLNLNASSITALPSGLDVGEHLDLRHTAVQGFPQDLRVGGQILPPSGLRDIRAFMEGRDEATIHVDGTHHERMRILAGFQPFPDLLTTVLHLVPDNQIGIRRDRTGTLHVRIIPRTRR